MPPSGIQKGSKRARQYEHVKEGELNRGVGEDRAEEIAARTVNKARAQAGESKTASPLSIRDKSPSQRGGQRSGRSSSPKGRTRDQLYEEARKLKIEGRSKMGKAQLKRSVDAHK
jgi:hypothetical protein